MHCVVKFIPSQFTKTDICEDFGFSVVLFTFLFIHSRQPAQVKVGNDLNMWSLQDLFYLNFSLSVVFVTVVYRVS